MSRLHWRSPLEKSIGEDADSVKATMLIITGAPLVILYSWLTQSLSVSDDLSVSILNFENLMG